MTRRLLLIIDPQIDFITGSLPVPGAEQAMNSLAGYIRKAGREYSRIIVTADRHPMRHCSFREEGGQWPRHCVADSVGAAIYQPIMDSLLLHPDKVTVLHKGQDPRREEYSIFKNADAASEILRIIESDSIDRIDLCGLAGDVCVADTLRDGIDRIGTARFNILTDYTPSIDGGKTLRSLIALHSLTSS